MSDLDARVPTLVASNTETLFAVFLRIVSVYCLMFGVLYWVRLIGYFSGPTWRFDLMPVYWQVVSAMLSVFFPFAAIGLWMLASWGPVIWFICAVTEAVMFGAFPHLFGRHWLLLALHGFTALLYIAFRIRLHMEHRRAERDG